MAKKERALFQSAIYWEFEISFWKLGTRMQAKGQSVSRTSKHDCNLMWSACRNSILYASEFQGNFTVNILSKIAIISMNKVSQRRKHRIIISIIYAGFKHILLLVLKINEESVSWRFQHTNKEQGLWASKTWRYAACSHNSSSLCYLAASKFYYWYKKCIRKVFLPYLPANKP